MTTIDTAEAAPAPLPATTSDVDPRRSPDSELVHIRQLMPALLELLEARMRQGSLPVKGFGGPRKVLRLSAEEAGPMEKWFFIGDLHGDFFALSTLLRKAEEAEPDCRVLFLGDMVDRGDRPLECIFALLYWGMTRPGRLAWLAGNHDLAFSEGSRGSFSASVKPAEFLQVLNASDEMQGFRQRVGRFFIKMAERLPRAMLFPDGLLATHGGFPLSDLQAKGTAAASEAEFFDWLCSENCLTDFTWTRIHSRHPKKLRNPYDPGSQYGYRDFEAFCALKPEWFPVKHMVIGHVHPAGGFESYDMYKVNPVLSLRGFGFDDNQTSTASAYGNYEKFLRLGRGRPSQVPEVIDIAVDRGELAMLYPDIPGLVPASAQEVGPAATESVEPPAERSLADANLVKVSE